MHFHQYLYYIIYGLFKTLFIAIKILLSIWRILQGYSPFLQYFFCIFFVIFHKKPSFNKNTFIKRWFFLYCIQLLLLSDFVFTLYCFLCKKVETFFRPPKVKLLWITLFKRFLLFYFYIKKLFGWFGNCVVPVKIALSKTAVNLL